MTKDNKNNVGFCYKCGSPEIEYGKQKSNGEEIVYKYFCTACRHRGCEVYNVVYVYKE